MKAIINGKRYDTKTATEITDWSNGASGLDFDYCAETLYRTKKGSWFLAGVGGARSAYAQSCEGGRASCGGGAIVPLTEAEAKEWLELHGQTEALEQYFGESVIDA